MVEKRMFLNKTILYQQVERPFARFLMEEVNLSKNPLKTLRQYTGWDMNQINRVVFNPDRDTNLLLIIKSLKSLTPQNTNGSEPPNNIRIKEISRKTGLSPEKIINLINKFQPVITIEGVNYNLNVDLPEPSQTSRINPNEIKKFRLNPKRILKKSRYESRPPGGGPVQKARVQELKIADIVKREAVQAAKISFIPIPENKKSTTSQDTDQSEHPIFLNSLCLWALLKKKLHNLLKRIKS